MGSRAGMRLNERTESPQRSNRLLTHLAWLARD